MSEAPDLWCLINYIILCSVPSVQPLGFSLAFTSFRGKKVDGGGGVLQQVLSSGWLQAP